MLFVMNLWSIRFLKNLEGLFSISSKFQITETSRIEFILSKVGRCYFTKYKLHGKYLMSKFSEILKQARRKTFSGFDPIWYEANLIAPVSLLCT